MTDASTAQVLRLRLTDVSGWNATIDGRTLDLDQFSGIMLQARIPPGRHVIELHYWPKAFAIGLVLALGSFLALVGALVGTQLSRRKKRMVGWGEKARLIVDRRVRKRYLCWWGHPSLECGQSACRCDDGQNWRRWDWHPDHNVARLTVLTTSVGYLCPGGAFRSMLLDVLSLEKVGRLTPFGRGREGECNPSGVSTPSQRSRGNV